MGNPFGSLPHPESTESLAELTEWYDVTWSQTEWGPANTRYGEKQQGLQSRLPPWKEMTCRPALPAIVSYYIHTANWL